MENFANPEPPFFGFSIASKIYDVVNMKLEQSSNAIDLEVRNVKVAKNNLSVFASSTPIISFETDNKGLYLAQVFDISGKEIHSEKFEFLEGVNQAVIQLNAVNGVYFLRLSNMVSKEVFTTKFLKL